MAKEKSKSATPQARPWFKPVLDETVQRMIKAGAVRGAAVEAVPVWMVPDRILISRIWGAAEKSRFIWAISGPSMPFDHIPGDTAVDAQAAARHFSLKWQMDAERLRSIAKGRPAAHAERIETQAAELVQRAELLYDLSCEDAIWQERPAG